MSRIILTGSNGFIGRRLAQALVRNGHEVIGVDIVSFPAYTPPCRTVQTINADDLTRWSPQEIILCGAVKGLAACSEGLVAFDRNISQLLPYIRYALVNPSVHTTFISSDMVFGGLESGTPFSEDSPMKAGNTYGKMKIAGEQLVSLLPNHAIVRTALVYGELDSEEQVRYADELNHSELNNQSLFYSWLSTQVKTKGDVKLADNVYSTPTWVMDLVQDVQSVVSRRLNGIFHSCGKRRYSRLEMGVNVLRPLELDHCVKAFSEAPGGLRPLDVSMSSKRTEDILGRSHAIPESVMTPWLRKEFTSGL